MKVRMTGEALYAFIRYLLRSLLCATAEACLKEQANKCDKERLGSTMKEVKQIRVIQERRCFR